MTQEGDESNHAWFEALYAHQGGKLDRYEFDWSTNGCNDPAPDELDGFDFRMACWRHDFGYGNYSALLGKESFHNSLNGRADRDRVDRVFLEDLNRVCESRAFPVDHTDWQRAECRRVAPVYYKALLAKGWLDTAQ
ncbi:MULTISPECIES: phospholipase A2 [unclassified Streptomyces]|uniref:phospholipase A2 n=1 Tax=unclassified Streptomyces TaxID=2593676 RepID=UPI0037F3864C